jgi:hypothetical protein
MTIKFKINGQNWKIKTVTSDEMQEHRGDGEFAGLCIWNDKLILIHEDDIDFTTVCHEIYHGYFGYLHLDDTNELKISDYEEITASWFASNAEEVIKKARQLTRQLQRGV